MKSSNISIPDYNILKRKYKNNLDSIINKVNNGYPVQYLIGNVEFLNTIINVNKDVLIPRFETEYLVDLLIKLSNKTFLDKNINIIDLGTGSGAIAIALKKNLNASVYALDISSKALKIAKTNALFNKVNINFINKNIGDNLINNYDIIVSNPPYIAYNAYISKGVKDYEPHIALYAKENGLYYLKIIINKHLNNLNTPGIMALEFGDNQKQELEDIVKNTGYKYFFKKDLNNLDRYLFIIKS